jgi:hypothetical protein
MDGIRLNNLIIGSIVIIIKGDILHDVNIQDKTQTFRYIIKPGNYIKKINLILIQTLKLL